MLRPPVLKFVKNAQLLCLVCSAVLFAACNQSPPSAPRTESPTAARATTLSPSPKATKPGTSATPTGTPTPFSQLELEAKDLRGTIVRYWHVWSGPAGETMESLVKEFNLRNQWGIMVAPFAWSIGGPWP